MSKVQQIQSNYQLVSKERQANFASRPSFGTGLSALPPKAQTFILDGVESRIHQRLGRIGEFYQWLAGTKGEIQSQLINALFTSTLAPIMIAWNPFSKTDKKTKEYTALRQPISAAIAISGGLAMTLGLNRYMDKMYNDGYNKAIDLRLQPNKDYLKLKFRQQHNIRRPYLNKIEKEQFKAYLKKVQEERLGLFASLITEKPENIHLDESTKTISIGKRDLQQGHEIKVPNLGTRAELEEFWDANSLHRRKFGDFLKDRFGFEFFENGEVKPHVLDSKLSEVHALDFLHEFGLVEPGKVDEEELRKTLLIIRQERNKGTLANLLDISEEEAKQVLEINGKIGSRNVQMTVGEEISNAKAVNLGHFFPHLKYKPNDGTLQALMNKPMAEVLTKFSGIFKGRLEGFNEKANLEYFAKNILKNTAHRMGESAKNYKFFTGIFFNLFTTAVTCTILNWAYPRIVERVFPSLVKDDKKGGNK